MLVPINKIKTKISRRVGSRSVLKYLTLLAMSGFGFTIVLLAQDIAGIRAQPMFSIIPNTGDRYRRQHISEEIAAEAYVDEAELLIEEGMQFEAKDAPPKDQFPDIPNPFPEDIDERVIHVLLTLDKTKLLGLPTFVNSVLKFTKSTRVRFHIIWCQDSPQTVKQYLGCFNINGFKPDDLDVVGYAENHMTSVFRNFLAISGNKNKKFKSCSELVALQAHRIFPYLDRILWLDTDMIVQADLSEIWDTTLGDRWMMWARSQNQYPSSLTYEHIMGHNQYATEVLQKFQKRYSIPFVYNNEASYNEVSLLHLCKWRAQDEYLQKEYAFWMNTALSSSQDYLSNMDLAGEPWWFYGGQAISWFTFQQNASPFSFPGWHCDGLGWKLREEITYHKARNSKLLHWNGEKKPWLDQTSPHIHLYNIHKPQQCRGKGLCTRQNSTSSNIDAVIFACPSSAMMPDVKKTQTNRQNGPIPSGKDSVNQDKKQQNLNSKTVHRPDKHKSNDPNGKKTKTHYDVLQGRQAFKNKNDNKVNSQLGLKQDTMKAAA